MISQHILENPGILLVNYGSKPAGADVIIFRLFLRILMVPVDSVVLDSGSNNSPPMNLPVLDSLGVKTERFEIPSFKWMRRSCWNFNKR